MPNLQVPDEARPALARLARLDSRAVSELVQLLEKASPKLNVEDLTAAVAAEAKSVQPADTKTIVVALRELALVRAISEIPPERFISDVADSMAAGDGVTLNEDERTALVRTLSALMKLRSIDTPAKARSLVIDSENTLCRARIITDVRPVFGADVPLSRTPQSSSTHSG